MATMTTTRIVPGEYEVEIEGRKLRVTRGRASTHRHGYSGVAWYCWEKRGRKQFRHFLEMNFRNLSGLLMTIEDRVPKYVGRENDIMRWMD